MPGNFVVSDTLVWSSNPNTPGNQQGVSPIPTNAQFAAAISAANPALGPFDVHGYRSLWLEVLLSSFTGGATPTWQPEWDAVDDAAAPNALPLFKPTAASAATKWLWQAGAGQGAAPTIAGWTVSVLPTDFGSFGQLQWVVTGGPTAVAVAIYVYGKR